MKFKNIIIISFFLSSIAIGQENLFNIEKSILDGAFYYDLSDNYKPSIEVTLWGAITAPGIYKLEKGTNVVELLSYAGGLRQASNLEEIRIIRKLQLSEKQDSIDGVEEVSPSDSVHLSQDEEITRIDTVIILDYSGLFESDELTDNNYREDLLEDGDIIILPREETEFKEEFRYYLSLASMLTSLIYLAYIIINR